MFYFGIKHGKQKRFTISCDPEFSHIVKVGSGGTARWSAKEKNWTVPADPTILRGILEQHNMYNMTGELSAYLDELYRRQERIYKQSAIDSPVSPGEDRYMMPFQNSSVRALDAAGSFILAHQMGLGKTPIVCQALEYIGAAKNLIVCPAAVKWSWVDHLKKWGDIHNIYVIESKKVKTDMAEVICTANRVESSLLEDVRNALSQEDVTIVLGFEMLRKFVSLVKEHEYDVMVVDEAHRVKNRKAQNTQAVMQVSQLCGRRWLLTGTPVRNDYTDLWSLLAIIDPDRFSSYWNFVNTYLDTVKNIFGGVDIVGLKDQEAFNTMLGVYMYKLTKEEVMPELPEIIYSQETMPMNKEQYDMYQEMENDFITSVFKEQEDGADIEKIITAPNTMAKIMKLRQICLSPATIEGPNDSAKLEWLNDRVEYMLDEGEQILIFSFFKRFINLVEEILEHHGLNYGIITGDVSSHRRHEIEEKVRSGEINVVAGTGQAMGEGTNFETCTTSIFTDLDWVPAVNKQAEERIQRYNTKTSPNVIHLYHPNTVETDIMRTLHRKEHITNKATGQVETIRNLLQRREGE